MTINTVNLRRLFTVFATALLVVVASVAVAVPTEAGPVVDPGGAPKPVAVPEPTVPELTVPGTGKKVPAFQSLTSLTEISPSASPGGYGMTPDQNVGPGLKKAGPRPKKAAAPEFAAQSFYCDEVIDKNVQAFLQVLHVDYAADVYCNFYLIEAVGVAGIIDRTPGFDGTVLSVGNQFHLVFDYYGFSVGTLDLHGNAYPGARRIEVVEELYLYSDIIWNFCNPLPNLRYLACDGLGTNMLHVVVGTGPLDTGLQDPLYMGAGQGDGCPVSTSHSNTQNLGPNREHFVTVGFAGTISCSAGVTGNSQARLIDEYQGNGELARGNDSGANGTSQGQVERRESEHGGREMHIAYSGRSVAPGNRTWSGCNDTPSFHFTRCSISGNTVDWDGVGPVFQTGLPTDRFCQASRIEPNVVGFQLTAKGMGTCNERISSITVTIALGGEYVDDEGTRHDVSIPGGGSRNVSLTDTDSVTAEITFPCDQQNPQVVTYDLIVIARFQHPEGWQQSESLGSFVINRPCIPA